MVEIQPADAAESGEVGAILEFQNQNNKTKAVPMKPSKSRSEAKGKGKGKHGKGKGKGKKGRTSGPATNPAYLHHQKMHTWLRFPSEAYRSGLMGAAVCDVKGAACCIGHLSHAGCPLEGQIGKQCFFSHEPPNGEVNLETEMLALSYGGLKTQRPRTPTIEVRQLELNDMMKQLDHEKRFGKAYVGRSKEEFHLQGVGQLSSLAHPVTGAAPKRLSDLAIHHQDGLGGTGKMAALFQNVDFGSFRSSDGMDDSCLFLTVSAAFGLDPQKLESLTEARCVTLSAEQGIRGDIARTCLRQMRFRAENGHGLLLVDVLRIAAVDAMVDTAVVVLDETPYGPVATIFRAIGSTWKHTVFFRTATKHMTWLRPYVSLSGPEWCSGQPASSLSAGDGQLLVDTLEASGHRVRLTWCIGAGLKVGSRLSDNSSAVGRSEDITGYENALLSLADDTTYRIQSVSTAEQLDSLPYEGLKQEGYWQMVGESYIDPSTDLAEWTKENASLFGGILSSLQRSDGGFDSGEGPVESLRSASAATGGSKCLVGKANASCPHCPQKDSNRKKEHVKGCCARCNKVAHLCDRCSECAACCSDSGCVCGHCNRTLPHCKACGLLKFDNCTKCSASSTETGREVCGCTVEDVALDKAVTELMKAYSSFKAAGTPEETVKSSRAVLSARVAKVQAQLGSAYSKFKSASTPDETLKAAQDIFDLRARLVSTEAAAAQCENKHSTPAATPPGKTARKAYWEHSLDDRVRDLPHLKGFEFGEFDPGCNLYDSDYVSGLDVSQHGLIQVGRVSYRMSGRAASEQELVNHIVGDRAICCESRDQIEGQGSVCCKSSKFEPEQLWSGVDQFEKTNDSLMNHIREKEQEFDSLVERALFRDCTEEEEAELKSRRKITCEKTTSS